MLKKTLFALFTTCVALAATAQPRAHFETQTIDLGVVLWKKVSQATFTVTNSGTTPLVIRHVEADCECTAVDWPRTPIAPGETGRISVEHDGQQLGTFQRALLVSTNAPDSVSLLWLTGRVARELPLDTVRYANRIGHIRLDTEVLEFDDVNHNDRQQCAINLYNAGGADIQPVLMHLPPYLSAVCIPERVRPGQYAQIVVTLDGHKLREKGLTQTTVYLGQRPGESVSPQNEIAVSAILLPDFDKQPPQVAAHPPVLSMDTQRLSIERPGPDEKKRGRITLTNTGGSTLELRSVQVMHPCIAIDLRRTRLKPGQSTKLKVTVDGRFLKHSKSRRRILITTNDPAHPKAFIDIVLTNPQ